MAKFIIFLLSCSFTLNLFATTHETPTLFGKVTCQGESIFVTRSGSFLGKEEYSITQRGKNGKVAFLTVGMIKKGYENIRNWPSLYRTENRKFSRNWKNYLTPFHLMNKKKWFREEPLSKRLYKIPLSAMLGAFFSVPLSFTTMGFAFLNEIDHKHLEEAWRVLTQGEPHEEKEVSSLTFFRLKELIHCGPTANSSESS